MCGHCRATSYLSHPITGCTLTRLTGAGQSPFCSLTATVSHVARERWLQVFWILLIRCRYRSAHWDLWNRTIGITIYWHVIYSLPLFNVEICNFVWQNSKNKTIFNLSFGKITPDLKMNYQNAFAKELPECILINPNPGKLNLVLITGDNFYIILYVTFRMKHYIMTAYLRGRKQANITHTCQWTILFNT